ncbi:MAG: DUF4124 domain-containing protein [Gammaproteobacteria bacterium]|jgi:hypothetical protein|nr:DUF4124 domain-containing protein [Gammaproteobacteria bacterium]
MKVRLGMFVMLAWLALPFAVGAATVYKWMDPDGNVHFSDRPGDLPKAEKVEVPVGKPGTTPPRPPATSASEEAAPQQPDAAAQQEIRKKNCEIARKTLEHNENIGRMYRLDESGERVFLTDEERAAVLQRSRDDVAKWCDD